MKPHSVNHQISKSIVFNVRPPESGWLCPFQTHTSSAALAQAKFLLPDGEWGLCLIKQILSDLNLWCNTRCRWESMKCKKAVKGKGHKPVFWGRTQTKCHFLMPELLHLQTGKPEFPSVHRCFLERVSHPYPFYAFIFFRNQWVE